jgi:hypothetical protein
MLFECTHAALSATRLKYGGLFDASRGVSGLMAAAYKPELAVSIGSYMHDLEGCPRMVSHISALALNQTAVHE